MAGLLPDRSSADTNASADIDALSAPPIVLITNADYTIADSSTTILGELNMSTAGSNRTVTLPTAADNTEREILILKIDSGVGTVILDGEGAETINGAATATITDQYGFASIKCNGAAWFITGTNVSALLPFSAILADGTVTFTANQPMGGFNLTGLGAAVTTTANPSATGVLRNANNEGIGYRNAANSADLILKADALDQLNYDGIVLTGGESVITGNTTINDTDGVRMVVMNGASGDATLTLPTLADNQGREITIINNDGAAGHELTIDGEGAETVGGTATRVLTGEGAGYKIFGGAAEWHVTNTIASRNTDYTPTYTGNNSMTWTSVTTTKAGFIQIGQAFHVWVEAIGTVGGTPSTALRLTMPVTFPNFAMIIGPTTSSDGGTVVGSISDWNGSVIQIFPDDTRTTAWTAGASRKIEGNWHFYIDS